MKNYSWFRVRDLYNGKVYPGDYKEEFPSGWWEAFGEMMFEELEAAIKAEKLEDEFVFEQIKEKFGELRIYFSPSNEKIHNIINAYAMLSNNICIECGQPDVSMLNMAWIHPLCKSCYEKQAQRKRETRPEIEIPSYEEYAMSKPQMANSYKVTKSRKVGNKYEREEIEYDISETANKVRENWNNRRHN